MSTIDKFMIRAVNPVKEELRSRKPAPVEDCQSELESDFKTPKVGKRKKAANDGNSIKKFKNEDSKREQECPSFVNNGASKTAGSVTEISYEDYLNENCNEQEEPELLENNEDVPNEGRDIRNFFLKGPVSVKEVKEQKPPIIKVKAEIHEPSPKVSSPSKCNVIAVPIGQFTKLKGRKGNSRKKIQSCVEITDDDLVIECLDDELCTLTEKAPQPVSKAETENKDFNGLVENLNVPSSINGSCELTENGVKEADLGGAEHLGNNSEVEQVTMLDVLMGKTKRTLQLKHGEEKERELPPKSRKEKRKDSLNKTNEKKKPAIVNKELNRKSVTRDDEETRVYTIPDPNDQTRLNLCNSDADKEIPSVDRESDVVLLKPEIESTADEVCELEVSLGVDQVPNDKTEGKDLRRSQRRSALLAISAISHAIQETAGSKRLKKTTLENVETTEIVNLDSDADGEDDDVKICEVKHSNGLSKSTRREKKIDAGILAPIFLKPGAKAAGKISAKKLSPAEEEALSMKRNFLLSGVPDELKKIQISQLATIVPVADAPFPNPSHTFQGDSGEENLLSLDPWNLPGVLLKLNDPVTFSAPSFANWSLDLFPATMSFKMENVCSEVKNDELVKIADDLIPVLLSEIKSNNPSFPTDLIYHRLKKRKEREKIQATVKPADSMPPHLKRKKHRKSVGQKSMDILDQKNSEDTFSEVVSVLWTDKYAPSKANELIGNWDSCKKLRDWLEDWKKVIGSKLSSKSLQDDEKGNNDTSGDFESWSSDSAYSADAGPLCNTVVLLGPSGVGKTSMVYALAQELDFKVFEVNSSGCRDGRHVLTQLQEATQSHQVSNGAHTENSQNMDQVINEVPVQGKNKEKRSKEKGARSADPVAGFLSNWSAKQSKLENKQSLKKKLGCRLVENSKTKSESKKTQQNDLKAQSQDVRRPSLILFDEVDNVLEDDRGFWSAIQTFMKTTKRPIVLTASDRNFREKFGGRFECLRLRIPQTINIASYAQIVCLLENTRTDYKDILSLVELNRGDIRRTILLLQYWIESGAARQHVYDAAVKCLVSAASPNSSPAAVPADPDPAISSITCETKMDDIDDDFQCIVRRKRHLVRIDSCEETSSQSGLRSTAQSPVPSTFQALDDAFQDGASLAPSDAEFSRLEQDRLPFPSVEAVNGLTFPLHRLSVDIGGGDRACGRIQKDSSGNTITQFCGNHCHRRSSIFNDFIDHVGTSVTSVRQNEDVTNENNEEQAKEDSQILLRALYDAYNRLSFADICRNTLDRNRSGVASEWDVDCCSDSVVETVESLILSTSVTNWESASRKSNQVSTAATSVLDIDHQIQRNTCYRLAKENTDIIESITERNLRPTVALSTDYLPALRAICKSEELRKSTVQRRRRFNHYLSNAFPSSKASLFKNLTAQFL